MILIAATISLEKHFLAGNVGWLRTFSKRRGSLNITGGMGMIAAGVIGAGVLGFIQDKSVDSKIAEYDKANNTALHNTYVTENKTSLFGDYQALNQEKLEAANTEEQATVSNIQNIAKKGALRDIVIFPLIMLVSYVLLILYFSYKGGYKAVVLQQQET
jgi:hypothetical protein